MRNKKGEINLEEIAIKYRPTISFRLKRSLDTSSSESEDIVNEIINHVIEKIKKGEFRGESSIGTFIYTITSRKIIDKIRAKNIVMKHVTEQSPNPDPHKNIENKDRSESMANAIKNLKPKYRKVLYRYYYKEFSSKEIAQKLGISRRRVSELVNYCHKLLKKLSRNYIK